MTSEHELTTILETGETLTVEFKSDAKSGLPDRDLVAAVVAMANTEGGLILLGVEDDGSVTGVQTAHQDMTGLKAMIANRTSPPTAVSKEIIEHDDEENPQRSLCQKSSFNRVQQRRTGVCAAASMASG